MPFRNNPLYLPEIIGRVAEFITLWEPSTYGLDFLPKDFIAASMVNHAWHALLTPRLWEVFDSDDITTANIPPAVVEARSHHIRYLSLSKRTPSCVFHSTQLRELIVAGNTSMEAMLPVIRANPSLTFLNLTLPYRGPNYVLDDNSFAPLEALSRLEHLELHWWTHISTDRFIRILNNNPRLKVLKLLYFGDLLHVEGCLPLKHLTDLSFNSFLDASPGLAKLVRHCPSLVNLSFFPDATVHVPTLAKNLRECCPRLTTIQNVASIVELDLTPLLDEEDYPLLIQSSTRLEHLDIATVQLTPQICETLVACHSNWIRKLRVDVSHGNGQDLAGANTILQSCTQLESFEMTNNPFRWDPDECVKKLFELPWDLPNLRSIIMRGFREVRAPIVDEEVSASEQWDGFEQDQATQDVTMDIVEVVEVNEQGEGPEDLIALSENMDLEDTNVNEHVEEPEEPQVVDESVNYEEVADVNEQGDEATQELAMQSRRIGREEEVEGGDLTVAEEIALVEAADAEYAAASGWIATQVPGWDNLATPARRRLLDAFLQRARTCHNLQEITLNTFEYVRA